MTESASEQPVGLIRRTPWGEFYIKRLPDGRGIMLIDGKFSTRIADIRFFGTELEAAAVCLQCGLQPQLEHDEHE
jgi:hypothetical protein